MTEIELLEDVIIQAKVIDAWEKVFNASHAVIRQAKKFGYDEMLKPSPNIHEMLVHLQIFSTILDILIFNASKLNIPYDETRLMFNAKEQITRMERLAAALNANNRADFDAALESLENQAAF